MITPATSEIEHKQLLLVEGKDDEGFFQELRHRHGISSLQIENYEGKNNLRAYLHTLRERPRFEILERIGITRDADESKESAKQSVYNALSKENLPLPGEQPNDAPIVSVLILPPERNTGCLETLIWESIETTTNANCIREFVDCINARSSENLRTKAKVHAYIAAQSKPGLKIGEATKAGYWDLGHPAFDSVTAFLRGLAA